MSVRLPQTLKICLSTLLAALLIGMQNIDEYAQQLGSRHPELIELSQALRSICRYSGLPQWFAWQKDLYSTDDAEPEEEPFSYDEANIDPQEEAHDLPSDDSVQPAPASTVKKENQSPDIKKTDKNKKCKCGR